MTWEQVQQLEVGDLIRERQGGMTKEILGFKPIKLVETQTSGGRKTTLRLSTLTRFEKVGHIYPEAS